MRFKKVLTLFLALVLCLTGLLFPAVVEAEDDVIEDDVIIDETFDDYEAGTEGSATKLSKLFAIEANAIGDSFVRVNEDENGNLNLLSCVFTQVYLQEPLKGPYTFSVSSPGMQGGHQAGFFLRAPASAGAYYEGDAGDPERPTSCGFSGLWFYGYGDQLEVNVKTLDASMPFKIKDNTVALPMPQGSCCGNGQSADFRFEDDGTSCKVFIDNALVCTAVFSVGENNKKARTAGISASCFKTVTVLDADGNQLMTVENTLVSSTESVVGWATRVSAIWVDNVRIEADAPEEVTEVPTEPETRAPDPRTADELEKTYPVVHTDRRYPWLRTQVQTYTYDFSETDFNVYSKDKNVATASLRTNMLFEDGVLKCKPGKTFAIGSGVFLGDDYGITGGTASFKLDLKGGTLSVGTRLEKSAADPSRKGLWFTFTENGITVCEPTCGFYVTLPVTLPSGEGVVTVTDDVDNVTLTRDGKVLVSVQYLNAHGDLQVRNGDGTPVAYTADTRLNPAGYFTLYANGFDGSIDDLTFTHVNVEDTTALTGVHKPDYSTWVATDDRSRTTPVSESSTVRPDKQVGLFYFVCNGGGITSDMPLDITTLYNKLGRDGFIAYLSDDKTGGNFRWAEPYFGYYQSIDTWVMRKHAYMLEAAGVDFIFLDNTNGATYNDTVIALFDTWLEIRKEGHDTPQICFFGGGSSGTVVSNIRATVYSDANWDKYSELFYTYEGKPLYLGDKNTVGENDRAWVDEHFTVRNCLAWGDTDGAWNWLQEYRISPDGKTAEYAVGGPGRDVNGRFEELALCVAHHPTTNKGRSYVNTVFPKADNDFGFSLDSGAGAGFAGQWEAIRTLDPTFILITGWNEWTAGLLHGKEGDVYAGTRIRKDPFYMIDTFNTEYSRDAEPMRLRQGELQGFGDNYYYQMVSVIREFKGMGAVSVAAGQGTVDIRKTQDWANVGPVYGDTVGDNAFRHQDGTGVYTVYVNNTGRNDFDAAKVSQDSDYLYFTVNCVNDIVRDSSPYASNWMNLFINLDGDPATGWEGFDFVVNRNRDAHYVSIESLANGWDGTPVGQALYTVDGRTMTVRVSKAALGASGDLSGFLFKWADNSTWTGNVLEFMDYGDTAPNDRFAYKYVGGMGETRDVTYTLDGEALRDECQPLPDGTEEDTAADTLTDGETSANEPADADTGTDISGAEPSGSDTAPESIGTGGCGSVLPAVLPLLLIVAVPFVLFGKKRD